MVNMTMEQDIPIALPPPGERFDFLSIKPSSTSSTSAKALKYEDQFDVEIMGLQAQMKVLKRAKKKKALQAQLKKLDEDDE
jgi:hypothetical protein